MKEDMVICVVKTVFIVLSTKMNRNYTQFVWVKCSTKTPISVKFVTNSISVYCNWLVCNMSLHVEVSGFTTKPGLGQLEANIPRLRPGLYRVS